MPLTKITTTEIDTVSISQVTAGPTIANVSIANSTYAILDDTAVSNAGGYIVVTGTKFQSGAQVLIGNTVATSVTFVDSARLNVQVPALSTGTYTMYIQNPDGSTGIRLNALTSSPIPVWATGSTLTEQVGDAAISISLAATSDSNVTFSLANGSSLPAGTTLASNGLFSGTVTGLTSDTTYNFSINAVDAENQEALRSFTVTVTAGDVNLKDTVLLLNGEASNNTWITDVSNNNFSLTVNADARPMAFSPYETVWSNFFDGTGDYLTVPANAAFDFGTADYTIEGWINVSTTSWTLYATGGSGSQDQFSCDAGTLYWAYSSFSGGVSFFTNADLNKWTHVAVSRSSGTTRIFKNGTVIATSSTVASIGSSVNTLQIGRRSDGIYLTNGYMSNIRVLKGTGLYTSSFTPSTSPLTAIANTVLLTCQTNRLRDASTNNFTITKNGDVTVSNFGPFVETDVTTGSGYFDGTSDLVSVAANTAFDFGTGDFTVEGWVYPTFTANQYFPIFSQFFSLSLGVGAWGLFYRGSAYNFDLYYDGQTYSTSTALTTAFAWNHIAVSRSSGTIRLYINGVLALTQSYSGSYGSSSNPFEIGASNFNLSYGGTGYISDVRVVKGTAVYTSAFTPPTSPLTPITNTSLLTLQSRTGENNSRFVDTSGINNIITRNGNAAQGTFSPHSLTGWSNFFDGSSTLTYTGSPISTSQSNFTIEAWVFPTANPTFGGSVAQVVVDANGISGGSFWGFGLTASRNVVWRWYDGGSAFNTTSVGTVSLNQWTHIAVSVNSNTIRLFINGTLQSVTGTSTLTNRGGNTGFVNIGRYATTDAFFGYISNARLIAGTGLYTSSFTPSITALTAISNTSLLTCQSNRFVDNSTNNVAVSILGSPSVQPFSPFKATNPWSANTAGGSGYFDGTGDYLTVVDNVAIRPESSDFTIEAWVYLLSLPGSGAFETLWANRSNDSLFGGAAAVINSSGNLLYFLADSVSGGWQVSGGSTGLSVSLNSWQHIALVRSGNTVTMYRNGVAGTSTSVSGVIGTNGNLSLMAGAANGAQAVDGYMSNFRMLKGTALYTSSFTPPTVPPTPIAGTTLLVNGINGSIIDYTSKNNLETVGNAQLRSNIKKYGNTSIFFDGTGDTLKIPYSQNFVFGSGNWTVELWVYLNSTARQGFAALGDGAGSVVPWEIGVGSAGKFRLLVQPSSGGQIVIDGSTTPTTGIWYHIAGVRNGGTATLYVNGIAEASSSSLSTNSLIALTNIINVGTYSYGFELNGYIDDLRITKGVARYTANFTPPTQTLQLK